MNRSEIRTAGIEPLKTEFNREVASRSNAKGNLSERAASPIHVPLEDPPEMPSNEPSIELEKPPGAHISPVLRKMVDHGVKVEIDRREQERIAREGRIAGAD